MSGWQANRHSSLFPKTESETEQYIRQTKGAPGNEDGAGGAFWDSTGNAAGNFCINTGAWLVRSGLKLQKVAAKREDVRQEAALPNTESVSESNRRLDCQRWWRMWSGKLERRVEMKMAPCSGKRLIVLLPGAQGMKCECVYVWACG